MLNFPLPASGMLDSEELGVLKELSAWIAVNGEGIYGTRPWTIAGEGPPVVPPTEPVVRFNERSRRNMNTADIRFTTKSKDLYVFVMGWPDYAVEINSLGTDSPQRVGKINHVDLVGGTKEVQWQQSA
jgi:alpha-L-fucosidase